MAKTNKKERRENEHESCSSYRGNHRREIRDARWNKRRIW